MIFKDRAVRYIFIVSLSICILYPLISIKYIYPLFTQLLIENTEEEAVRTARHLEYLALIGYSSNTKGEPDHDHHHSHGEGNSHELPPSSELFLSSHFLDEIGVMQENFKFIKLKVFKKDGEIIYSTDASDVGTVNEKSYFHGIVAKGMNYTKIVKKDTKSLEGELIRRDVVETYVPVMSGEEFVGAFEIYYDVTGRLQELLVISRNSSAIPFGMMLIFLIVISILLVRQDKSILRQKDTEGRLVELNAQLEGEIEERNRAENELVAFTDKLEESNKELQDFAHIASHDLQEPLRKILSFGDRLKDKCGHALDEKGRDYLERMQKAAQRMQGLINGLLMFSRVKTRAKPFEPVDLGVVSKEVLSDLEVSIQESGGVVELSDLHTIDGDPLQVRQLFQNMISNALKFHKKGASPVVRVTGSLVSGQHETAAHDAPDAFYQIDIEDNGIGFDEKYADRIFGAFQRLHGRNEYEGTGIGLSVCRRIVERHGGNIRVKSSPGNGATFTVTLPVRQRSIDGEDVQEE